MPAILTGWKPVPLSALSRLAESRRAIRLWPVMQRFFTFILVVFAVLAGALAFFQHHEIYELRRARAQDKASWKHYREIAETAQAEVARLKSEADIAKENIARLTAERDAALARAKSLPPGGPPMPVAGAKKSAGETGGGGMMEGIAKMYSTEEGRKMMRAQMAMGLKMQYGGLGKDLKLDPKVADQVFALLGDRQAALSEATFAAMKGGTLDEAATKEISGKSAALKQEYDEKLKAVLGDTGMSQLHDYERTLGDRMMLNMHEQQFSASGSPLESGQRDSLLQIMKDERLKTPAGVFDQANGGDASKAIAAMRDDSAIEKWIAQEQDYQQRVVQAATKTLNPDQVNALQESFKQQLELQRFGVKMSKEMFKGTDTPAPAPIVTDSPEK